jgi:hypothetical protein
LPGAAAPALGEVILPTPMTPELPDEREVRVGGRPLASPGLVAGLAAS